MAVQITMPRLSDSMEEALVLSWLKSPGEQVSLGEELVEIETDKATMTYEAEAEGVLLAVVAPEGETVAFGALMAWIGEPGETPPGGDGASPAAVDGNASDQVAEAAASWSPGESGSSGAQPRQRATPVARRLAADLGVEIASVRGTGPNGRITKADVKAAAPGRALQPAEPSLPAAPELSAPSAVLSGKGEVELQQLTRLQQTVARRMSESKATVPEFVLFTDVDMGECVELRARLKTIADPAPTYNDMIIKATAIALREFPRANGSYRDGAFELHQRVNVGFAVASGGGLVVPTVFDADFGSLGKIARETRALAAAVRDGSVTAPQLSGATISISNLGMYGVDAFSAIVNPPHAAILSVGAISRRAVVAESGEIVAGDVLTLGLSCDHRILYGAEAAQFLGRIRELLQQPLSMAL